MHEFRKQMRQERTFVGGMETVFFTCNIVKQQQSVRSNDNACARDEEACGSERIRGAA
jgi:hypothetical protein